MHNMKEVSMKYDKIMFGVMAVLCLLLLAPHRLCAETPTGLVDTPRTREVRANEPKTPEELLQVLKSFMDNPRMNGYEFGEKISGIARENWGKPCGSGSRSVAWMAGNENGRMTA